VNKFIDKILRDIPTYTRFLTVSEIDKLVALIKSMPGVEENIIGRTVNNEPLLMLTIGTGKKTAMIIGVPHSDEPLGSLVVTFFARGLAKNPETNGLGWRWLFIPILERRGMRLNEGWFNMPESLAAMAKSTFREPTELQYEWTFPISYDDYQWTKSRPETIAVKEVLENEKPDLLCGLHHSGFTNAYYYFSEDFPEVYPKLKKFAASIQIPLSDTAPDVSFGKMLSPGFYQMYGLKDYIDYYTKKDPMILPSIKRGACSDEWYQNEIGGFSFNCEVPMYLTPKLRNKTPSRTSYRKMIQERYKRKITRVAYSLKLLDKLRHYAEMADSHLMTSAEKHISYAQASLEHEKRILSKTENRPVTKAEKFENSVLEDLFDLFFLGQIWRVAESICIKGGATDVCHLMEAADLEIKALAKSIQERGAFYHIPIRTSVKMQLGSLLIIAEEFKKKELY
jgi:hypothetical protein